MEQAAASQAAKYPYRLEGDAASGYTVVSNATDEAVSDPQDHQAAAKECGERNLAATADSGERIINGCRVKDVAFCDCSNEDFEAGRICDRPDCVGREWLREDAREPDRTDDEESFGSAAR